jgi:hypothetical protein
VDDKLTSGGPWPYIACRKTHKLEHKQKGDQSPWPGLIRTQQESMQRGAAGARGWRGGPSEVSMFLPADLRSGTGRPPAAA